MAVSKKKFHAALRWDGRTQPREFPHRPAGFAPLLAWRPRPGREGVHAGLEASGSYGEALARFLQQAGHTVSLVHPRQIRALAETELARHQTDPLDAAWIARFCQAPHPPAWPPPAPEGAAREARVRRRDAREEMRPPEAHQREVAAPAVRPSIGEFLQQPIQKTPQTLRPHRDSHPDLRARRDLRVSIPGIAEKPPPSGGPRFRTGNRSGRRARWPPGRA